MGFEIFFLNFLNKSRIFVYIVKLLFVNPKRFIICMMSLILAVYHFEYESSRLNGLYLNAGSQFADADYRAGLLSFGYQAGRMGE